MKRLALAASLAAICSAASAEGIDKSKVRSAISDNTNIQVSEVIATRTSEDGSSTAYFWAQKSNGRIETGTASFLRMDDGNWYLTHAGTHSGIRQSPFAPVDIE